MSSGFFFLTWKRFSSASGLELEPTSHSIIEGHFKRWFKVYSDLLAMYYTHLHSAANKFWLGRVVDVEGELFAYENLNLLPDELMNYL